MFSSGRFSPQNRSTPYQNAGSSRQSSHHGAVGNNPFLVPSANSNSKFTPTKIGLSRNQNSSANDFSSPTKPPKPPEKPLTPYMRYSRKMWEKVRAANPDSKLWDIGKVVGSMWRELPDQGKQIYFDEYEIEKVEYEKSFKAYKNSAAYVAYEQQSRNKSKTEKNVRSTTVADSGIYIQPVDEDDGEEHAALMQLVGARFERNQKLMLEIFNSTIVPDPRTVISGQRMSVLKRQVKSLTTHQRKLEDELEQLEAKFQDKKRSISESSQTFAHKLKKVCEEMPTLDESKFDEMVEKATVKLLQSYEEYKQKQREAVIVQESQEQPKTQPSESEMKPNIEEHVTEKCPEENTVDVKMENAEEKIETPAIPVAEEEPKEKEVSPSVTRNGEEITNSRPLTEENKNVEDSMDAAENENDSEMDDDGFTDED